MYGSCLVNTEDTIANDQILFSQINEEKSVEEKPHFLNRWWRFCSLSITSFLNAYKSREEEQHEKWQSLEQTCQIITDEAFTQNASSLKKFKNQQQHFFWHHVHAKFTAVLSLTCLFLPKMVTSKYHLGSLLAIGLPMTLIWYNYQLNDVFSVLEKYMNHWRTLHQLLGVGLKLVQEKEMMNFSRVTKKEHVFPSLLLRQTIYEIISKEDQDDSEDLSIAALKSLIKSWHFQQSKTCFDFIHRLKKAWLHAETASNDQIIQTMQIAIAQFHQGEVLLRSAIQLDKNPFLNSEKHVERFKKADHSTETLLQYQALSHAIHQLDLNVQFMFESHNLEISKIVQENLQQINLHLQDILETCPPPIVDNKKESESSRTETTEFLETTTIVKQNEDSMLKNFIERRLYEADAETKNYPIVRSSLTREERIQQQQKERSRIKQIKSLQSQQMTMMHELKQVLALKNENED